MPQGGCPNIRPLSLGRKQMRESYEGKTHCANVHLLVETLRTWTNQQGQVRRRCNRCVGESQVRLKERLKKSGEWSLRIKTNNLRRRFGLTLERFNELLRLQNYKCADCHTKIFPFKAGTLKATMGVMESGKSCGACHNKGKDAFPVQDDCSKCHKM